MKLPVLIMGILMSTEVLIAQTLDYKEASTTEGSNYYEVVQKQRAQFEKQNRERQSSLSSKKQRKQFERWAYFWKDRVDENGAFPNSLEGWYNAGIVDENGQLIKRQTRTSSLTEKWTNVGPKKVPEQNDYPNYPQMGRLNTFLEYLHPTNEDGDEDVYLVGAPSGGIWKSTDGGETWTPKLDQLAGIGVTDIKSSSDDFDKPGVIYVSTGDYDAVDVNSLGVYKSTDFGETYTATKLTFSLDKEEVTSNLIVLNDTTVIVGTKSNIKKTTDGGATWTDVVTGSSTYPESFGRFVRHGDNIICTGIYGGVYLSTDKGDSWSVIITAGDSQNSTIATVDNSTGIFYLQDMEGNLTSYNVSTLSQTSLGKVPDYDSQSGYNQTLIVKEGLIISGGVNGLTSADNGSTWYRSLNGYWEDSESDGVYIHSDHHAMGDLDPEGTDLAFYSCNDGGLAFIGYDSKTDKKPSYTEYMSSGVLVTQMYSVAITPQNADYFLTGNQDNDGFSKEMHNGKVDWVAVLAGDGTATAIDYSNSNIRYMGSQNGGLLRTDSSFSGHFQGTNAVDPKTPDGAGFVWPLKLHSTIPTTLFGGFGDVYKSTDKSETWTNLNSGVGQVSVIETFGDNIFAIGEDAVKKTTDGGSTWTALVEPASVAMSSLTFNQKDPSIVYAAIPSYVDGEKVYKSTDGGKTWTNISTGLPNIVMKTITLYQNQTDEILFLGTELGVYYKKNDENWMRLGDTDMPNVIITDLEINYTTNTLVVSTYGRGLWQRSLKDFLPETNTSVESAVAVNHPIVKTNPVTNGEVEVILNNDGIYQYDLYNVIGGIASSGTLNNQNSTIDVSTIVNGIYILRTVGEDGKVSTQKVVVKN